MARDMAQLIDSDARARKRWSTSPSKLSKVAKKTARRPRPPKTARHSRHAGEDPGSSDGEDAAGADDSDIQLDSHRPLRRVLFGGDTSSSPGRVPASRGSGPPSSPRDSAEEKEAALVPADGGEEEEEEEEDAGGFDSLCRDVLGRIRKTGDLTMHPCAVESLEYEVEARLERLFAAAALLARRHGSGPFCAAGEPRIGLEHLRLVRGVAEELLK